MRQLGGQDGGYAGEALRSDLQAGLTVGVMLIPQGMAYALIAGMPPIYGLYSALVPLVVYALLGSSRQLAVGPVAIVSLLVAAGVAPLAEGDPERWIGLALLLALMVGVLQLAMGLLRFGFLTNFLSHPVLAGFTSAAAIVIGASQLRHLVGVDLPSGEGFPALVLALVRELGAVHLPTLALGIGGILLLVGARRWVPRVPGALVLVVVATLVAVVAGLEEAGVRLVGEVPAGLPMPVVPPLDGGAALRLLPVALTIALIGFMESVAVAKVYAGRHGYRLDANQELVALGAANLVGAFFRSFPVTGGFSRTAVNEGAGARTQVASLVSAAIVGLTLLFLTGLFAGLPNAALAAIVMVAVAGLIDWREARHLWQTDRHDFAMMGVTFGVTLLVGIEAGILAGVLASLTSLVFRTSRPHSAVLGRLPGSRTWRNLNRHPSAREEPGVAVLRIDATLCFANAEFLTERIDEVLARPAGDAPVRALVLDFHAVNGVDSTAMHVLAGVQGRIREAGHELHFAGVKGPVMDRLEWAGLVGLVGRERFHLEVDQAVEAVLGQGSGGSEEGESTVLAGSMSEPRGERV